MKRWYFNSPLLFPVICYFLFVFSIRPANGQPVPVPMSFTIDPEILYAGELFQIKIKIGNQDTLVENLFGLSFQVHFSATDYLELAEQEPITKGSIWSPEAFLFSQSESVGQINLAITEKAGAAGHNGTGELVTFRFLASAQIPDMTQAQFWISDIVAISSEKDTLEIDPQPLNLTFLQPPQFRIKISPGNQTINAGDNAKYSVSLTDVQYLREKVNLVTGTLTQQIQISVSPDWLDAGSNSELLVVTQPNSLAGEYNFYIEGISTKAVSADTAIITVLPKPSFKLIAEPAQVSVIRGDTARFVLQIQDAINFTDAVQLKAKTISENTNLQWNFEPGQISMNDSATFSVFTANTAAGFYNIELTGAAPAHNDTTAILLEILPAPDFSLSVTPDTQTVVAGETTEFTVNLADVTNFEGVVKLACESLAPELGKIIFEPDSLMPGQSAQLIVRTNRTDQQHIQRLEIIGTTNNLVDSAFAVLHILPAPDFELSISPDSIETFPGREVDFLIKITGKNDFNQPIDLSVGGLPQKITHQLSTPTAQTGDEIGLKLTIAADAVPGEYNFEISGQSAGLVRQVSAAIVVKAPLDFQLVVDPDSQAVIPGGTARYLISLDTGATLNQNVQLSRSDLPSEVGTVTLNPISISATDTAYLEIETNQMAESENHLMTVTGVSGELVDSVQIQLTLLPRPDFDLEVSPQWLEIKSGETADFSISIVPVNDFNELVSLSFESELDGGILSFSEPEIFPNDISQLHIQAFIPAAAREYSITIIAQSINIQKEQTVTLAVTKPQSLTGVKPNPFTPNQDGINDDVCFNFENIDRAGSVTIFNFRGKKIRLLENKRRWDGTDNNGNLLPPGVYLYLVKIDDKHEAKGTITLVR